MKRANNLLPLILGMDNLRLAFWKASKGKRYSKPVLKYQADLDKNLLILQDQILRGQVDAGDYHYFKVNEPKEREICASAFREQVLHHAIMNVCHDHIDRRLIYDCYASRKRKGTYAALARAQQYTRRFTWYLKLVVRKFFASVHHLVLKRQLVSMFKEQGLLTIFFQIIDSYESFQERGLPIGNLTSQYFANHYLCSLDHFIKEKLRSKAYVRYMDDMVLWHQDKATLKAYLMEIQRYLQEQLLLELKPSQLNRTSSGLPFLGYRIFPHDIRLLQKSKQRFVRKLNDAMSSWHRMLIKDEESATKVLPLLAFTGHARTRSFRRDVLGTLKGQTP